MQYLGIHIAQSIADSLKPVKKHLCTTGKERPNISSLRILPPAIHRLVLRWLDSVQEDLKTMGIINWSRMSEERDQWSGIVKEVKVLPDLYHSQKKKWKKSGGSKQMIRRNMSPLSSELKNKLSKKPTGMKQTTCRNMIGLILPDYTALSLEKYKL
jgi:hypothetical protein